MFGGFERPGRSKKRPGQSIISNWLKILPKHFPVYFGSIAEEHFHALQHF